MKLHPEKNDLTLHTPWIQRSPSELKLLSQQTDSEVLMSSPSVEMIDCSGEEAKTESYVPDSTVSDDDDPLDSKMIPKGAIKVENQENCIYIKEEV